MASGEVTVGLILTLSSGGLAVQVEEQCDRRPHQGGQEEDVSEKEKQRRWEGKLTPLDAWSLALQGDRR